MSHFIKRTETARECYCIAIVTGDVRDCTCENKALACTYLCGPFTNAFTCSFFAEKSYVEHGHGAVQSADRGGIRRALQGDLWVRLRLLEDGDVSLSRRRVSVDFYLIISFCCVLFSNLSVLRTHVLILQLFVRTYSRACVYRPK